MKKIEIIVIVMQSRSCISDDNITDEQKRYE